MPFSRPGVEFCSDRVAALLSDIGHAGSLRQVLTNEPVGVFIRATLPAVVGGCEIEDDASGLFDGAVVVKLGAVVGGNGQEGGRASADEFDDAACQFGAGAIAQLADQNESAPAFDQCHDAVIGSGADDGIDFPVAEAVSILY